METHKPTVVKGPDGRDKVLYRRTPETIEEIEKMRLGVFSEETPLPLSKFGDNLRTKNMIILAKYPIALRAIRTRLDLDKRPHRFMTGANILKHYLEKVSTDYLEGFPQTKHLYLTFSYTDSPNRRMADILHELMGLRYTLKLHCWLFLPQPLNQLALQWGESMTALSYLPLLDLRGIECTTPAPVVTAVTDLTPRTLVVRQDPREQKTATEYDSGSEPIIDPKLNKKRRRRG